MHWVHTYISSYFCFIVYSFCAAFKVSISVEGSWKSSKLYFKVRHTFLHRLKLLSFQFKQSLVLSKCNVCVDLYDLCVQVNA